MCPKFDASCSNGPVFGDVIYDRGSYFLDPDFTDPGYSIVRRDSFKPPPDAREQVLHLECCGFICRVEGIDHELGRLEECDSKHGQAIGDMLRHCCPSIGVVFEYEDSHNGSEPAVQDEMM